MTELSREARYMLVALLKKQVATLESSLKGEFENGVPDADGKLIEKPLRPSERRVVVVEVDGEDIELGGITRTKPNPAWKVTNESQFIKWVQDNHPENIEQSPSVKEWFTTNILNAAKAKGAPVTDEGEEIPGIELVTGSSYVKPTPATDAVEKVQALVSSGGFTWGEVLQIEAAP